MDNKERANLMTRVLLSAESMCAEGSAHELEQGINILVSRGLNRVVSPFTITYDGKGEVCAITFRDGDGFKDDDLRELATSFWGAICTKSYSLREEEFNVFLRRLTNRQVAVAA